MAAGGTPQATDEEKQRRLERFGTLPPTLSSLNKGGSAKAATGGYVLTPEMEAEKRRRQERFGTAVVDEVRGARLMLAVGCRTSDPEPGRCGDVVGRACLQSVKKARLERFSNPPATAAADAAAAPSAPAEPAAAAE